MRCPACGNDEVSSDTCSQCHTPLSAGAEDSLDQDVPSTPPKRPAPKHPPSSKKPPQTPPPQKEGKHRPRPLHDLDLTLPELEVQGSDLAKARQETLRGRSEKNSERQSPQNRDRKSQRTAGQSPGPQSVQRQEPSTSRQSPAQKKGSGPGGSSLDFSSYILSISTAALMALGGAKLPGMPSSPASAPKDISQAKELIDLLAMLEEKTEGNLTRSESELIKQTLQNLQNKLSEVLGNH